MLALEKIMRFSITILLCFVAMATSAATETLSLKVGEKTIELDGAQWSKMDDPEDYAKNFQERKDQPYHKFGRVVTVFLLPMSDDRKVATMKISKQEYLEIFIRWPGYVTVRTRVDKGDYWVMCRETFKPKSYLPITIDTYEPFLSEEKQRLLWTFYDNEIDKTRFLLKTQF